MPSFIQDKKTVLGKATYGSFLLSGKMTIFSAFQEIEAEVKIE
jgi:hypothetical protein